jgi:hypothetical protein
MFEHLDDPNAIEPGRRELSRVLRRAELIRARRRWVAAVSACTILLAGSIGLFVTRTSGNALAATTTAYQFSSLKGPLEVGTPVPATALIDVVFPNALAGFGLAVHQGTVVLATSTDGGVSWHVRNSNLPPGLGADAGYPGQFEFVGLTGFLWGAKAGAGAPLWVTENDGTTWRKAPLGPYVYDVSAIGTNVWALSGSCGQNAIPSVSRCSYALNQSTDGGQQWTTVQQVPEPGFAQEAVTTPALELARITRARAYVLGASDTVSGNPWNLTYTADSGITWIPRPVPCNGAFSLGAELAASSTNDLWLLCGSQATAGSQTKELFRSFDGGINWVLVTSAAGRTTPTPTTVPPNSLPLAGYIAPFTVGHRNLAVASAKTAWLYPSRAGLYATTDGGFTWTPASAIGAAGFASGGAGNVTFASPTQGWICQYGVGLWHTKDGMHWHPLSS